MSRRPPIMFLDMSKKPGDADCVRTAEDILAENERLKAEIERLRQPGNVAALREALIKARAAICHHARYQCQSLSWENSNVQANCGDVLCSWRGLCEAKTAINAALSAPPRNCDVGTAEEQVLRWREFCAYKNGGVCDGCPCLANDGVEACYARWEQMPYEAEDAEVHHA